MEKQTNFRQAGPEDLGQLHRLVTRAYRGASARQGWTHEADLLGGGRLPETLLGEILQDAGQRLLVADRAATVVGCVQVARQEDGTAYIGLLAVEPSMQGQGLGGRLLSAAEVEARQEFGACRLEMWVLKQRHELIAYYRRRGFEVTSVEREFPSHDPQFGIPKVADLAFLVLEKHLPTT